MSSEVRAYGGWRERRGYGVGALTGPQTMLALGAVVASLLCVLVLPATLPLVAVPLALGLTFAVVRIRGESVAGLIGRHGRWQLARRTGGTHYDALATPELPGVLGSLMLHQLDRVAAVHDPQRRTLSAVVPVEPQGVGFVDAADVEAWVRGWGGWLAHLGYVPDLAHVQVTVHTGPQPPSPMTIAGDGAVGQVMAELQALSRSRNESRTLLTVTVRVTAGLDAAGLRLRDVLTSMERLNRCGMVVLEPLGVEDLSQWIRGCFDPGDPHGAGAWIDARPTATVEQWSTYQHDSGVSVGYLWDECPGESIAPEVLNRLLGPADYVKRVAIVYEPVPAHLAAREVDRQTQAAAFRSQYRRRIGRDETARERLDMERAQHTAHEQASGAGLVDVGMYVVATSVTLAELEATAADLLNRAGESRIRLRRAYGSQAQCFAVTLGLGYVPRRGVAR